MENKEDGFPWLGMIIVVVVVSFIIGLAKGGINSIFGNSFWDGFKDGTSGLMILIGIGAFLFVAVIIGAIFGGGKGNNKY